jgi:hypothetical protein
LGIQSLRKLTLNLLLGTLGVMRGRQGTQSGPSASKTIAKKSNVAPRLRTLCVNRCALLASAEALIASMARSAASLRFIADNEHTLIIVIFRADGR